MTARELLGVQFDQVTVQVNAVLTGLTGADWDARAVPEAMSPREVVAHLAEAAYAFRAHQEAGSYEWGSFRLTEDRPEAMVAALMELRGQALELAALSDDPKVWVEFTDYVLFHDAYHVGQLCTLRLVLDPTWNPHSIYGG